MQRVQNSKYNYLDQHVSGPVFYRLKMIDRDGSFKYSEIRLVIFKDKINGLTIVPNPARNIFTIYSKNRSGINSIQLISMDGKILRIIKNYTNGQEININNLQNGSYIIKVILKDGKIEYGRLNKI